ncbi:uncharacterized protein EV154DRAFT_276963 [Mucor mucedo]|uniref:uncharacterized protein n=1 Tax=Mucor mucedo TaxID=29922 RepID=UPI00221EFDB1|nr:uncharacterized protein EV154DRAFT_276963 [Mucor mucedo]KAI7889513.1 hypothetical protein EV154DRAFT_276963 [Mucor mucedo]
MLSISEKIIEDTERWSTEQDEQELTYYRRFASLLDSLFNKSEIKLADGETACDSSRVPIEVNKRLFNVDDVSPTYSRKIDLILKYNDRKTVELCSNEWKRSKVNAELKIKQQSKNLRVNALILDSLQAQYGPSFDTIMAIDMIGTNGYLYQLKKHDDYFVATPHSTIVVPLKFNDLNCLKTLITSLFRFKEF